MPPLYEYRCRTARCVGHTEAMRKVEDRFDAPQCYHCKGAMYLVISPVHGIVRDPASPKIWKPQ